MASYAFIFFVIARIIIRSQRVKLAAAGIYHLVNRIDVVVYSYVLKHVSGDSRKGDDIRIGKSSGLRFINHILRQRSLLHPLFEVYQSAYLAEEPAVYFSKSIQLFNVHQLSSHYLRYTEYPLVVAGLELFYEPFVVQSRNERYMKSVALDLDGSESLHQRAFKGPVYGHYLSRSLHLGSQLSGSGPELIKWPLRELDYHIVEGRLKARAGGLSNVIVKLIQIVADGYLGCYLGDRIACRL